MLNKLTETQKRTYLMTAGTLFPAFVGIIAHGMYHKRLDFKASDILIFAGLSIIGGYATAQILK